MNIHAMLTHVVLSCKLFGADTAWKALTVISQVSLHMPSKATAVVERPLTQPATWVLFLKVKSRAALVQAT